MTTHSSIHPQKIPWAEEPGRPQYMELQRVRDYLAHMHNKEQLCFVSRASLTLWKKIAKPPWSLGIVYTLFLSCCLCPSLFNRCPYSRILLSWIFQIYVCQSIFSLQPLFLCVSFLPLFNPAINPKPTKIWLICFNTLLQNICKQHEGGCPSMWTLSSSKHEQHKEH